MLSDVLVRPGRTLSCTSSEELFLPGSADANASFVLTSVYSLNTRMCIFDSLELKRDCPGMCGDYHKTRRMQEESVIESATGCQILAVGRMNDWVKTKSCNSDS